MSKRGELLKTCLDRDFTLDTISEYVARINSVPEDQREAQAEKITREIEQEYPLIRTDTNVCDCMRTDAIASKEE